MARRPAQDKRTIDVGIGANAQVSGVIEQASLNRGPHLERDHRRSSWDALDGAGPASLD
jgi:hypothetical protein